MAEYLFYSTSKSGLLYVRNILHSLSITVSVSNFFSRKKKKDYVLFVQLRQFERKIKILKS